MAVPKWHWTNQPNAEEIKKKCIKTLQPGFKGEYTKERLVKLQEGREKYMIENKNTEEYKQSRYKATRGLIGNTHAKGRTPWNKGIRFDAIRGENNPNWKGGKSLETRTERYNMMQTVEYKNWRREVFTRDNHTCQKCGEIGGKLTANHDLPYSTFPDLRLEVLNGETLCESCHLETTKMQRRFGLFEPLLV